MRIKITSLIDLASFAICVYVLSYVILSAKGEYSAPIYPSPKYQWVPGLPVHDTCRWLPCFYDDRKPLASIWFPLLWLDRQWIHPDYSVIEHGFPNSIPTGGEGK